MCEFCNGTGGVTLNHSWGAEFLPCLNSDCDYDRESDIRETENLMEQMKQEIYARGVEV